MANFRPRGTVFIGVFSPKAGLTQSQRDAVKKTAKDLIGYNIPYTVTTHLGRSNYASYTKPNQITSIRCDGVVEYSYEWHNIRIHGSDKYWDITYADLANASEHYDTIITPKKQCQKYMTIILPAPPEGKH